MNQIIGKSIYHILQIIRREPVFRVYEELKKSENLSVDELKKLQFDKFKNLLTFAYENIDFYRMM